MKNITVVGCPDGDWEGLYVDGRLVFEGHSIQWRQMLEALDVDYNSFDCDQQWLFDNGLPKELDKVKAEGSGEP